MLRFAPLIDVILFEFEGAQRWFFFFLCLAIIGKYESRFGGAKSRFGCLNSRFALLREFAGKGLGYLNIFSTKW